MAVRYGFSRLRMASRQLISANQRALKGSNPKGASSPADFGIAIDRAGARSFEMND